MTWRLAVLFLCLVLAPTAGAVSNLSDAAGRYSILNDRSTISFFVGQVGGGGINGRFADFSGAIRIDPSAVERSQVEIAIRPQTVFTGQSRVDEFLRSNAVFDVANAPVITFRSTSVRRTGDTTANVEGRLTARGHTLPETFSVELTDLDRSAIHFRVRGDIRRAPYGMDVGTPIYSNIVRFDMDFTARRN